MIKKISCVSISLLLFSSLVFAEDRTVFVDVVGARNNEGQVGCALFDSAKAFPNEDLKAFRLANSPINSGRAHCEFPGIPDGIYALAVMHDQNHNNRLDTGLFGIPQEGFGFSNGAQAGFFSPARFEEAQFAVKVGRNEQKITLTYR